MQNLLQLRFSRTNGSYPSHLYPMLRYILPALFAPHLAKVQLLPYVRDGTARDTEDDAKKCETDLEGVEAATHGTEHNGEGGVEEERQAVEVAVV